MNKSPKMWRVTTRLPAGGKYPPYGHLGHWEVTQIIAEDKGFGPTAVAILCDASQDPDFYDFATIPAHAQTDDKADDCAGDDGLRQKEIDRSVDEYVNWILSNFQKCQKELAAKHDRLAIYWLGYLLHGIEDLAVHIGMTNGEHASSKDSPDYNPDNVPLSIRYAKNALDAVREALGQKDFDRLRYWNGGGKLSHHEKTQKDVHGHGWDLLNEEPKDKEAGRKYKKIKPPPEPVRWDREVVLGRLLDGFSQQKSAPSPRRALPPGSSRHPGRSFEPLVPRAVRPAAEWTVLVYMAGDDSNPDGIEYAIGQDLAELKKVGSTGAVHLLAQTDDASGSSCYRYRLRKKTDLTADRLEAFRGDLNTGSVKTLVDFVQWGHDLFPAKRYALVLWGHGSGHDDKDVYRLVRGKVSPRIAARLAHGRLGFFSGTKRTLLEQGPTRGYGYDDTAGDFLDNRELRKALQSIKALLGQKLDLLGFDACLMAMVEVAYQVCDLAKVLVCSERTEPGDGWWYEKALKRLPAMPALSETELAKDIVSAYKAAYKNAMTLSAVDLSKIDPLVTAIGAWANQCDPADFHLFRRKAVDCSPRGSDGYCDLSGVLTASAQSQRPGAPEAAGALKLFKRTVLSSCGGTSGLTIYAPGNFRPDEAGSTDALYMGLKFAKDADWASFLRRVYPRVGKTAERTPVEALLLPSPSYALDRYNSQRVLAASLSGAMETWVQQLRSQVLAPFKPQAEMLLREFTRTEKAESGKAFLFPSKGKSDFRIFILPGIMGSLLHDGVGRLGRVWIDPWGLAAGQDWESMRLKPVADIAFQGGGKGIFPNKPLVLNNRIDDADSSVKIMASGVMPIVYDRLALALMLEFGPVVEQVPFDWRQPIRYLGDGFAKRIEDLLKEEPNLKVAIVAHSMGGLVTAEAMDRLKNNAPALNSIKAVIAMGTPWLGSFEALRGLRGEKTALSLFGKLTGRSREEMLFVAQSFWGLTDLMPGDREELLHPSLYAPGPLAQTSPGSPQLRSPLTLKRELPPAIMQKTRAVVCTSRETVTQAVVTGPNAVEYLCEGGGDGTVPEMSATHNGLYKGAQCVEVDQEHSALPLDGAAIQAAIDWIAPRLEGNFKATKFGTIPSAPAIERPANRDVFMGRLEADNALQLGDLLALMPLL